ncbi:MAG: hypothetical protein A2Y07_01065 [Planctomycetes bacterium GWF2_50_10]|nr:MAG: hypothetical protein A2Y07_01065 [Planctomycetes bacterium GWF2_50_10]
MFSRIAKRYDRINTVISLGADRLWRSKTASLCDTTPLARVADLCSGTGELALVIARSKTPLASISCYDISQTMLDIARQKYHNAKRTQPMPHFEFITADCAALPCPDNEFDLCTCAFGLRNTDDPAKTVSEMFRILKPRGRLCILEFTLPKTPVLRKMYMMYFRFVLPILAALFGGDRRAYEYFVKSVCRWDMNVDVPAMLTAADFKNVRTTKLTLGIAAIYTAEKP